MSKKASRSPKSKKLPQTAQRTISRISPIALILGAATLIGGIAALATLLPRLTVVVSDPPDADDPFSSSVTVTNTGYIPLESVIPYFGLGQTGTIGSPPENKNFHPTYLPRFARADWRPHYLWLDDKFTFALNDFWETHPRGLAYADIAIRVGYQVPLIHWKREKVFPMYAHKQTNGNFYWYAKEAE
jgi:hypothetical protein